MSKDEVLRVLATSIAAIKPASSGRNALITADRSPWRRAFTLDPAFPSGVRGPVDCSQGLTWWAEARNAARPSGVSR